MKESFAFYADVSWFVSNLESAYQVNVWYFIIINFFFVVIMKVWI